MGRLGRKIIGGVWKTALEYVRQNMQEREM